MLFSRQVVPFYNNYDAFDRLSIFRDLAITAVVAEKEDQH